MLKRLSHSFPGRVGKAYSESHAATYAASLTLNTVLALFPMLLGTVTLLDAVIHNDTAKQRFFQTVASIFPSQQRQPLMSALNGIHQGQGLLTIIAVFGILWGGTNLFGSMELAFTEIFGGKRRDLLRERAMGAAMVVVFLLAVVVAVFGDNAASTSAAGGVVDAVFGGAGLIVLLALLYRWVPNRTYSFRQIVPGAVLAGLLIEGFAYLFPAYAGLSAVKGFGIYGQQLAMFFLIVIWLLFTSQFLLLGAVFNRVRLGAPTRKGAAAAPGGKGRDVKQPVQAENEQRKATGRGAKRPQRSRARGRR